MSDTHYKDSFLQPIKLVTIVTIVTGKESPC
jgi:hypothetical protein